MQSMHALVHIKRERALPKTHATYPPLPVYSPAVCDVEEAFFGSASRRDVLCLLGLLAPSPPVGGGGTISGDVPTKCIEFVFKGRCSTVRAPVGLLCRGAHVHSSSSLDYQVINSLHAVVKFSLQNRIFSRICRPNEQSRLVCYLLSSCFSVIFCARAHQARRRGSTVFGTGCVRVATAEHRHRKCVASSVHA